MITVILLIGLGFLLRFSSLSLPDPVWLSGIYEDAGVDKLVVKISAERATDEVLAPLLRRLPIAHGVPRTAGPALPPADAPLPFYPRSPPSA